MSGSSWRCALVDAPTIEAQVREDGPSATSDLDCDVVMAAERSPSGSTPWSIACLTPTDEQGITMTSICTRRRRGPVTAAVLTSVVASVTALGASGCSAQSATGSGTDVVAVTQRLVLADVCRDVSVVETPDAAGPGTAAADLVQHSLGCGYQGTPTVIFSTFNSAADRDTACAALSADPAILCGTDTNLWVARADDAATLEQVRTTLGSAVTPATKTG